MSNDKWTGPDKVKHAVVGFVIGFTVTFLYDHVPAGGLTGTGIGALKELYDRNHPGHQASAKDFVVTAAAAWAGAGAAWLVRRLAGL